MKEIMPNDVFFICYPYLSNFYLFWQQVMIESAHLGFIKQ